MVFATGGMHGALPYIYRFKFFTDFFLQFLQLKTKKRQQKVNSGFSKFDFIRMSA